GDLEVIIDEILQGKIGIDREKSPDITAAGKALGEEAWGGFYSGIHSSAVRDHRPAFLFRFPAKFGVAMALDEMVIDHAGCLHMGVADGAADEFEAAQNKVLAHGVRSEEHTSELQSPVH